MMEKHLHKYETTALYQKDVAKLPPPHVSLIDETNSVAYLGMPEDPVYNLYDILWSDGKATQEVRPISDGVTPIGLCVIPTNWLAEGEKARFISLKYMSCQTPESGSLTSEWLSWGESYYDNQEQDPLKEYYTPYVCKGEYYHDDAATANYYWSGNGEIKDLRERANWLYTLNYCKETPGKYAIGDINGKQNTVNISVEGNYCTQHGYADYDMKPCIAKYATPGTQAGDWYIPAMGELMQFIFRLRSDQNSPSINDKVAEIAKIYPKDCVTNFSNDNYVYYWSSTVKDAIYAFFSGVDSSYVDLGSGSRDGVNGQVVAYLLR